MSIIKLEGVCFSYGHNRIFDEINLEINRGEYVGIIGKNGSGKSTLLKLILGQLKPICGEIIKEKLKIGYVEQVTINSENNFPASVYEIVMLGLYKEIGFFKFPNKEQKEKVLETLKSVGLEHLSKKQISKLSGGEQQKVMLAKALVNNPDLIILDEPTTAVDSESENNFFTVLKQLNEDGKTIVIVTHDNDNLKDVNKIYKVENLRVLEVAHV